MLEIMVAMAILAGALTWLVVGMSRNIRAENHAKLIATGTFLARGKMIELEDELYDKGFGEFEKELSGAFGDKGFERFGWRVVVDKVELPSSEQLQTVLTNAQQAQQTLQGGGTGAGSSSPSSTSGSTGSSPLGAGANALGSQFGVIKEVLEQGIRRVTVKVGWIEGRTPQEVELIAYYTDPRKVDQAIQLAIPAGAAGAGTGTGTGTGSGTGTGTGATR